jgi:hypothetical protein
MKIYAMIYASGEKKKIVPPILGSTVKTNIKYICNHNFNMSLNTQ